MKKKSKAAVKQQREGQKLRVMFTLSPEADQNLDKFVSVINEKKGMKGFGRSTLIEIMADLISDTAPLIDLDECQGIFSIRKQILAALKKL